jgi:hypothetical protein
VPPHGWAAARRAAGAAAVTGTIAVTVSRLSRLALLGLAGALLAGCNTVDRLQNIGALKKAREPVRHSEFDAYETGWTSGIGSRTGR